MGSLALWRKRSAAAVMSAIGRMMNAAKAAIRRKRIWRVRGKLVSHR
jgi:hypothetical protein